MEKAPIKADEAERLAALRRYAILDTPAEETFDDVTRLATHICGAPIAMISLVDTDRQWLKSKRGIAVSQIPRDISFCGHAIHGRTVFEVPNALEDERFRDNPLVTSEPNIRFYAATPLVTRDGYGVGTLCVIDSAPHRLDEAQRDALAALGRQVVRQLELRHAIQRDLRLDADLKALTHRLEQATRAAGIGIWDYDPSSQKLIWDEGMYRLYRVEPDEFAGVYLAWSSRVHPDDLAPTAALLEAALRGEANYDTTFRICDKNGAIRFIKASASILRDETGRPLRMIGINYDVTEQKHAETAAQEQAHYTQAILDNVIDGIITIDDHGAVASVNQSAERIFGFSSSEVLGQNVKILMPEPYHSEHDGYLANYRATGVERVIGIGREVVGRRKNGDTFPMELAVSEIRHGGKRMFVGLVRDITERKRVEKMKSEFVSTVSHELRTPLTSISGALGLIVGGALGDLPELMQPMIDIAHKNSLRLAHLVNDLLDMEKLAAGMMRFDFKLHALMPLVEQVIASIRTYAEQFKVSFALTRRADAAQVRVDGDRLQQVLTNFLSNAAKFSPIGATVAIEVVEYGRAVRVTVIDHGSGIPEEFRARIFQKFSQADSSDTRQKGGTGLGLAISKELIESMNGSVGFASKEGEGARFHFELPLW